MARRIPPSAVVVLVLLALSACKEQDMQVVRATAEVRDAPEPQARSRETLIFSRRVRVAELAPWRPKTFVRRAGGDDGYVARNDLAPFPLKGDAYYAVQDGVPIRSPRNLPEAASAGVARGALSLGDKVEVVANAEWLEDGRVALLKEGNVRGFLDAAAVSPMVPTLAAMLSAIQQQALYHRMDAVERLTRNAVALHPGEAVPRRLLAEILRRRDDTDEADSLLKDLPPLPALPALPGLPPEPFKPAWVQVDEVVVRKAASTEGDILDTLRTNHPVAILEIAQGWAKVRTNLGGVIAFDPFGKGGVSFPGGRQVQGFVPAWALSLRAQDETYLLRGAARARQAGNLDESLVLVARAMSLQARETTEKALVETSFQAGRFDVLMRWLSPGRAADAAARGPRHAMLLHGCDGDLTEAAYINGANDRGIFTPLHDIKGAEEAAREKSLCVTGVDFRPPCSPRYVPPTDCTRFISEEDCEAPAKAEYKARLAEFQARVMPGYNQNRRALEKRVDGGSWLRFTWRELMESSPEAPAARGERLVFWATPLTSVKLADCQGGAVLDAGDAQVQAVDRPMMAGSSAGTLFVRVPSPYAHEYGVALADPAAVKAWLARRPARWTLGGRTDPVGRPVEGEDPEPPFPHLFVRGLIQRDCDAWCVD
ncbi:MAG: SH3 domain-containing protein [Deltaproteobacteria bacterium]|nr:SH3 domain-containing protein [Deltaproteobacteria bacterium]